MAVRKTGAAQSKLALAGTTILPCWELEDWAAAKGHRQVAGVDEVGRGPLAGSVVAAAVILPKGFSHRHLTDSKKLTPAQRAEVRASLHADADVVWALGEASVEEIDSINILQATFLAMRRAVGALAPLPDFLLIDGNKGIAMGIPEQTVVKGDARSFSIAAASILAKEHRDAQMVELAKAYPQYGFEQHKGYGTKQHREAILAHGPCPLHRRTFLRTLLADSD